MSHTTNYVSDQEQAKDFYVDKLGFELKTDYSAPNGFRWLAVVPKGQSEVEIALLKVGSVVPPEMKGESSAETAKKDVEAMGRTIEERLAQLLRLPDRRLPQDLCRAEG